MKSEGQVEQIEKITTNSPPNELHTTAPNGPKVYDKMGWGLFMTLTCMAFLWIGSQIPLYLFGSVLPTIYQDIGGVDRYTWFVIGYLIPNAALCPFVGALSDLYGRQKVAIVGQLTLIIGPIITATAKTMNIAIAGQVFSGIGAGLNELIALAGTAEVVPIKDRGKYVGLIVATILPFCPSVLYAQLIAKASNWRYNGVFVGVWNFIGLLLCFFCYHDPPRLSTTYTRRDVLRQVDYIGGLLSTFGVTCFMMGMQWGASQYPWGSVHNVVPFVLGIVLIIAFFVYEIKFAKYPMVPPALFSKAKTTMIVILLITFLSGGNYFVLLLFWPTQVYNVYGDDPVGIGIRSLPIGFGIIGGAAICLVLIPITKGRVKALMIFFTAMMTAGTGAVCVSNPDNLNVTYAIVTLASIGVGGVIIPSSIIAQIACPDELIATITAITLSIRYLGGAIGFAVYANTFFRKFTEYAGQTVAIDGIVMNGIVLPTEENLPIITHLAELVGNARFTEMKELIATSPAVLRKDAYPIIISYAQKAFALAYRWPYWVSIAFGVPCFILSFFVKDIGELLTPDVAAVSAAPPVEDGEQKV